MKPPKLTALTILTLLALAACSGAQIAAAPTCDAAVFVDHVILDVPVETGVTVMPGTQFIKTWRLKNDGTCEWSSGYSLVFTGGENFAAEDSVSLPSVVPPGESVDISLPMTAPNDAGPHRGEWMLRNPADDLFGVGAEGDKPLLAEFEVAALPPGVVYAFDQVHCLAVWDTSAASFLPCEGEDDEEGLRLGYVRLTRDPALEGSSADNPPVIEVKSNNQAGGFIAGFFPPVAIQSGDRFLATVGCMDGNPDCSLLFSLEYELPDGSTEILGEWAETFDDVAHEVEADLTSIAGSSPRLVLRVRENGGRSLEAIGFWLDARIER